MLRVLLAICLFLATLSAQSSAGNYSFTLDRIAVSTIDTGVKIDNKTYKYPFEHLSCKGYTFSAVSFSMVVYGKVDEVIIAKTTKKPSYRGYKRITVGHKTNVYVSQDRESTDSPTGDAYLYSFYFAGYEVSCTSASSPPPSFFSKIINTIKPTAPSPSSKLAPITTPEDSYIQVFANSYKKCIITLSRADKQIDKATTEYNETPEGELVPMGTMLLYQDAPSGKYTVTVTAPCTLRETDGKGHAKETLIPVGTKLFTHIGLPLK